MIYSLLADATVLVHILFVLFVIFGGLLVLRSPRLTWLHLPAAFWGAIVEIKGWICPLTRLENSFRRLGGESGYTSSFIEHYLEPFLYPAGLTSRSQVIMGLGVMGINIVLYCHLWRHGFRKTSR